jgi:hypothetical protein
MKCYPSLSKGNAGFGDFRARVSFRKTARVPQFCGLFVLIGIGPDKQCPMKLQRVPFNGPRSTPRCSPSRDGEAVDPAFSERPKPAIRRGLALRQSFARSK